MSRNRFEKISFERYYGDIQPFCSIPVLIESKSEIQCPMQKVWFRNGLEPTKSFNTNLAVLHVKTNRKKCSLSRTVASFKPLRLDPLDAKEQFLGYVRRYHSQYKS